MDFNRGKLNELYEKAAQKDKIDRQLSMLKQQKGALNRKEMDLRVKMRLEQADIEKLKKFSVSNAWERLIGCIDEKIEKEEAEALEATLRYEELCKEISDIESDIAALEKEQREVADADKAYDKLFREMMAAARSSGGPEAEKVIMLEEKVAAAESLCREIRQAIGAGKGALLTARQVSANLDSAKKWGTADMLGGGIITTAMKHEKINSAQADMSTLQSQIRRFRSELADVRLSVEINVKLDQFTSFADYFFDGLLVDGYIQGGISKSQNQVSNIRSQISSAVSRLEHMEYETERELEQAKKELKGLFLGEKK